MASDAPFHKVRWHVPAKSLGVQLPPGFHILEAPLQLFLCYGDQEIATYAAGTDPKEIERAAAAHAASQQTTAQPAAAAAEDIITGVPWSVGMREDAVRMAAGKDLHVIAVHLGGLDTLMDVYGYKAAHSVLRQISRRLKRLMDDRDRLTRHCGDKLLIFTTRQLEEIRSLVDTIHQQVAAVGLETDGDRLPRSRIGVATADRINGSDPVTALAVVDAVIISAEIASTTAEPGLQAVAPAGGRGMERAPMVQEEGPGTDESTPLQAHRLPEPAAAEPEVVADEIELPAAAPDDAAVPVYEITETEADEPLRISRGPAEPEPVAEEPPLSEPERMQGTFGAAPRAASAGLPDMTPSADGSARIRLKGASLDVSGMVATATVKLMHGEREVTGKAVGRNAQERRLILAAEAAARAITELLPHGYGVVVHDIQPAPAEVGKALWAAVLFLTPTGEESLLGIAPIDDMIFEAATKAVLNAVNRRIGPLLTPAP